jgi:hypothetical protein
MSDAIQDFLNDIPQNNVPDFFQVPEKEVETDDEDDLANVPESLKNRRHHRLERMLSEEKEARIRAEAKAEAISDARKMSQESGVDEELVRLYGADNKEAIQLHQALLDRTLSKAEDNAVARMRAEQEREAEEVKRYENLIDTQFESIEDEYNVDLTSNAPAARRARNDLIEMMNKLSPKDENGNITAYADFGAAWDILQSQKEKPDNTRNKDIASRGMTKSGSADNTISEHEAGRRQLRAMGINV